MFCLFSDFLSLFPSHSRLTFEQLFSFSENMQSVLISNFFDTEFMSSEYFSFVSAWGHTFTVFHILQNHMGISNEYVSLAFKNASINGHTSIKSRLKTLD